MQQPPGGPPGGGYPPPGGGGYGPPPGGFGPPAGGGGWGPPGGGVPPGGYGPPPGSFDGGPTHGGFDGGPQGMAPMPPPPKKGGISTAALAIIVVVAVVVLAGGCMTCLYVIREIRSANTDEPAPRPTPTTPPKPVTTPSRAQKDKDNWITAERPYVKFHPPTGWTTEITPDKEWGIFKSPGRDAIYAFTTFNHPGESTARLGRAASVLGVTDVSWGSKRSTTIGREHFDARVGDGSCNFHGPGGYIWYATVNAGTTDQILLIFTVAATAPKARRDEAEASIDSLQRR